MQKQRDKTRGADYRASLISRSAAFTKKLAEGLAPFLQANDLILAFGDLGAGKTCFSRGLAKGLGVQGEVASPSFSYLREYYAAEPQGLNFYHFDCYRFHSPEEWFELGFDEYLAREDGIALIEWPERVLEVLDPPFICLHFHKRDEADEREICLTLDSTFSKARAKQLLDFWQNFQVH